ncbi:hypothetical protein [Marinospirillum sp.]|uniref:hypothetical protein n=1 Tax=Marinospirillum sp. TaxID=2183934 RepID=UPI0025BD032E|nr:hypothetical protein [Marinospirillum sp.]
MAAIVERHCGVEIGNLAETALQIQLTQWFLYVFLARYLPVARVKVVPELQ